MTMTINVTAATNQRSLPSGPVSDPVRPCQPTILVAMGDEPLFCQGWQDGASAHPRSADAVSLSSELTLRRDEG